MGDLSGAWVARTYIERVSAPRTDSNMGERGLAAGDYPLLRPLGTGGLGVVHLTQDPWSGHRIAIKEAADAQNARERLVDEFNVLSSLDRPVVPSCGRLGVRTDGSVYLTMEHIRGRGMLATAKRGGPVGSAAREATARLLLRRLLRALVELHRAGVLHGDLKTRNMRLDPSGAVRLLDLGASRRLDPRTGQADGAHFMGTPRYAAPEQRARQVLDVRADLFSAGALTVRLLTGEKPEWPPRPPPLRDRTMSDLMAALLALDPRDRPQSAAEALAALPGAVPPLAAWWPGSARVSTDADPARRRARLAVLQESDAVGVVISTTGAALEAAISPLFSVKSPVTLRVGELHTADEAARGALARLLRRARRINWPLHLRATAAPDPALRDMLPLAAFAPLPVLLEADPAALCASGAWAAVLCGARGADPLVRAERPRIRAAIECWRGLGQRGEATRLLRSLQPLRSGAEHVLAASVALARGDAAQACGLARVSAGPRAAAIRWLSGDPGASLPAGPWGAWCLQLRGEVADITALPEGWRLEASTRRGEAAQARAWLRRHGLAGDPEAEGGLHAQIVGNPLKQERHRGS